MEANLHSHQYKSLTYKIFGHEHEITGTTTLEPDFPGHIHYISGLTDESGGNSHYFSIITDSDIETENGHSHFYQGFTTIDGEHFHLIYGYTEEYCSEEVKEEPFD